jgi:two-component system NtrC family response regulator
MPEWHFEIVVNIIFRTKFRYCLEYIIKFTHYFIDDILLLNRKMQNTILIIDDEKDIRQLLSKTMSLEGYEVLSAENAKIGLQKLRNAEIHVVLCDIKLPDANGVQLTEEIKSISPETEVICLTAHGTIQDGIKAMKNGAFDYLIKGDDNNKIIPLVSKASEKATLQFRVSALEKKAKQKEVNFDSIIGKSETIQNAINFARQVASKDTTVLLTGPTGTGKEVFANAIHAGSPRTKQEFVAVNCSAFGKDLLESELFGYKKGAFTGAEKDKKGLFEEAHNGTIFLDEIGELNQDLQAKLLRVLENGTFIKLGDTKESKVDVRVIAATNRALEAECEKGTFREDLFYRLSVFQIQLPSLNERKEDIPKLTEYFVASFSAKSPKKITQIDKDYIKALQKHNWKGNIRELRNIIERSVILCNGNTIGKDLLPLDFDNVESSISSSNFQLKAVEKAHIFKVLQHTNGNKTKAAELLGIGVATLYRKMEEYQL